MFGHISGRVELSERRVEPLVHRVRHACGGGPLEVRVVHGELLLRERHVALQSALRLPLVLLLQKLRRRVRQVAEVLPINTAKLLVLSHSSVGVEHIKSYEYKARKFIYVHVFYSYVRLHTRIPIIQSVIQYPNSLEGSIEDLVFRQHCLVARLHRIQSPFRFRDACCRQQFGRFFLCETLLKRAIAKIELLLEKHPELKPLDSQFNLSKKLSKLKFYLEVRVILK